MSSTAREFGQALGVALTLIVCVGVLGESACAQSIGGPAATATHVGVFEVESLLADIDGLKFHELTLVDLFTGASDFDEIIGATTNGMGSGCDGGGRVVDLELESTVVLFLWRSVDLDPCELEMEEETDLFLVLAVYPGSLAEEIETYLGDLEEDGDVRFHALLTCALTGETELQEAAVLDLLAGCDGVTPDSGDTEDLEDAIGELELDDARLVPLMRTAEKVGSTAAAVARAQDLVIEGDKGLAKLEAIDLVARHGGNSSAGDMVEALDDEGADIAAIVMTLGELGESSSASALEEIVVCGERDLKILALFALGDVAAAQSRWHAALMAQSSDQSIATAALYCLGRLSTDEFATDVLTELAAEWPIAEIKNRAAIAHGNPGWMELIFTW